MDEVTLTAGDYRLVVAPGLGGSVSRFDWSGEPLFRATCGPSVLDAGCFPLVPFSNRIAHGRFYDGGEAVTLTPNFPGHDHPHPLHGFGWLAAWEVAAQSADTTTLSHNYSGGEWPWAYAAEQRFHLTLAGLRHELTLTNRTDRPMPAGLGFHPYFPCTAATIYHGLHKGEWNTGDDGLPRTLDTRATAIDWWNGRPAATRTVDTVYAGRSGPLTITWPERARRLTMTPCDGLPFTVVYTPPGEDYLCVEPVSHATDAINMRTPASGYRLLDPGERWTVWVDYTAEPSSSPALSVTGAK